MKVITSPIRGFREQYWFLSNFYTEPDGTHVEGEYQRAKCHDSRDRPLFEGVSPKMAKIIGQTVAIRPDWEQVKDEIMLFYVTKKFKDHRGLLLQLRATGDRYLEETNNHGDTYWGVCRGNGTNMLGLILMAVRDSI